MAVPASYAARSRWMERGRPRVFGRKKTRVIEALKMNMCGRIVVVGW